MSERVYTLQLAGGTEAQRQALSEYDGKTLDTLRQTREITAAIALLFPEIRCRIISRGAPIGPVVKVLKG